MTWQTVDAAGRRREAGFTLIEILVVLAILGIMLGVIVSHGPMRSPSLDLQAAANQVARALRDARSAAIAEDRPVAVAFEVAQRGFRNGGGPVQPLPAGVNLSVAAATGETLGARLAIIRFNEDGSSSGGQVGLVEGTQRWRVSVNWITGRTSVARVR